MILSLLVIALIGLSGFIWLGRGFFSGVLHLGCVIAAGAIAFAAWEPAAYALLAASPTSGFLSFLGASAWGLGLALPFAISLVVLRLVTDLIVTANVRLKPIADQIGGAVTGAMSGAFAVGIIVIALGFLRLDRGMGPLGYEAARYQTGPGAPVVKGDLLWVPADKFVAWFYGGLSERGFRVAEPLARWHPDLPHIGATMRMSFDEGKASNTADLDDFDVTGRFTVGKAAPGAQPVPLAQLLSDAWDPQTQAVKDFTGQDFPPGSHLEGYVVRFKSSAKEGEGKVMVGAGQIRLVMENATTGERRSGFPITVSSQAAADRPLFGRWRFDSANTFIASVGGLSEADFVFEFVVPAGFEPLALYVKGARHRVAEGATATPRALASAADRDAFIIAMGDPQDPSRFAAAGNTLPRNITEGPDGELIFSLRGGRAGEASIPEGMSVSNAIGFTIQKGTHGSLELSEENTITGGEHTFSPEQVERVGQLERSLRVSKFNVTSDTVIVQVDVSPNARQSLLGRSLDAALQVVPPVLTDTNGGSYQPVGYIYRDETRVVVRFNPADPIRSLSQLPSLSRSRPAQRLTLIFRASLGVNINEFRLGNRVVARYDPPVPLANAQNNRN